MKDARAQAAHWLLLATLSWVALACASVVAPERLAPTSAPVPLLPTATTTTVTSMPTVSPVATRPLATATATAASVTPQPTATAIPAPAAPAAGDDAPTIVLDPGHDRTVPGALGIEYQETLRAARIAKEHLEAAGYRVAITRPDNDEVFVEDRALLPPNAADFHPGYSHAYAHASKALQYDPDLVLVLHFNGHSDPSVDRLEVYYCEMGGPQNLALAEIVLAELLATVRALGVEPQAAYVSEDLAVARGGRHFPSLGNVYDAPRTWLHNRYAGIPVVLTEPLYMTNPTGRALIAEEATHHALAEAYVRAVNRYFGR